MKRKNIFFTTLNTIYWNIFIFFESCLNFVLRKFICPPTNNMDWENLNQLHNQQQQQQQHDSSSSSSSSGTSSGSSSADEDVDMEHEEYVFRAYDLIKINYKNKNFIEYPVSRSGHRVVASDSHLFSLGGYNPRSAVSAARRGQCLLFQELWSYNFATNKWKILLNSKAPDMPRELASNALAIHNNLLLELAPLNVRTSTLFLKMTMGKVLLSTPSPNSIPWVSADDACLHEILESKNDDCVESLSCMDLVSNSHGGTGYPFGESCSNDCYVFTTERPRVVRLTVQGDMPTAQYGPGIIIHDNYLYTIGGTTGFDYSCDVYRLSLKTKVWENVYICRPEMREDPEGRYRHEVIYDGKHIYILGGGTSMSVSDLQTLPAFNLKTNKWDYFETKPDLTIAHGVPKPRKCFSCVQFDTPNGIEAYIAGGLQSDFTTYFADIWKINIRTMQWSLLRTSVLPRPLYFHSAATPGNGCMYIFGGIEYNKTTMRRRNDLYKMWMTIPKLTEMCWDAIIFYNPNLDNYNRSYLLKAGIPERFVDRVLEPVSTTKKSPNSSTAMGSCPSLSKRVRSFSQ